MVDTHTHVVLGGTGRIGSGVVRSLLRAGQDVRVVTRSHTSAATWAARGAEPVVAEVENRAAMGWALSSSAPVRVFALNPPGSIVGDPDADEDRTADAIASALGDARLERVVALSTYGAREGRRIGDLGTLHRFEMLLHHLDAPVAVVRAGYLYSNWDAALDPARTQGEVPIMLDPDRALPMVAPTDVGGEAARLLRLAEPSRATHYVEGPRRCTPRDVARAFAEALESSVDVVRTPPEAWRETFLALGFSEAAAESFTGLTRLADSEAWEVDGELTRGSTTLQAYIDDLVSGLGSRP